jgi:hypothetical protein
MAHAVAASGATYVAARYILRRTLEALKCLLRTKCLLRLRCLLKLRYPPKI